jgi:SAM-dependent methyltransferase
MASRSSTASSNAASAASSPRTPLRLVEARCALCGSSRALPEATGRDFEYDTCPNEFHFVRCAECAHRYLSPRPRVEDLAAIYPATYYAFASGGNPLVARLRRSWEGGKVRLYRACVGEGPRRILDVGCGNGRFLRLLRDFGGPEWELVGIDIDAAAVAECRAQGFEAHVGRVEDFEDPGRGFDAVIMLQLIEHVEDPVAICRRVEQLLRPGGCFVVETPNLAGLDYRLFRGACWGHYHFPRHWNLFSSDSLRRLLEDAGLRVERSESLVSTSAWTISLHNWLMGRGLPEPVLRFFHYQNPLLLSLFVALDWTRARLGGETSNQRAIARKPRPDGGR